jgi:Protein of unknown function (DUF4238)
MPANKSQHYVPLCYLRAFCPDGDRASINVLNFARERSIEAAPIKGQCAKDYFYGRDLKLELELQNPEGQYAAALTRALANPYALRASDMLTFHKFMLLQNARTEARMKKEIVLADLHRETLERENATDELLEGLKTTHEEAVKMAFEGLGESIIATSHMESRIFLNRTKVPFFTSDDPAIYTTRFHIQKVGLGGVGLSSPGGLLVMPLSPFMVLLSFDRRIYQMTNEAGQLGFIDRNSDVAAINQLQVIHSRSNLYFRDWNDCTVIKRLFDEFKDRRPKRWHTVNTLQEVKAGSGTFIVAEEGWKHDPARREMLHTARVLPEPKFWPRILDYTVSARGAGRNIDHSKMFH